MTSQSLEDQGAESKLACESIYICIYIFINLFVYLFICLFIIANSHRKCLNLIREAATKSSQPNKRVRSSGKERERGGEGRVRVRGKTTSYVFLQILMLLHQSVP